MEYSSGIAEDLLAVLLKVRDSKNMSIGVDVFSLVIETPFYPDLVNLSCYKCFPKRLLKGNKLYSGLSSSISNGGAFNLTMYQPVPSEPPLLQYNFLCFSDVWRDGVFMEDITNQMSVYFDEFSISITVIGTGGRITDVEQANNLQIWKPV